MKELFVRDIIQPEFEGQIVSIQLGVKERCLKTTRNGGEMMTLTLCDSSGQIDAVWFNPCADTDEFIASLRRASFSGLVDSIIEITGRVNTHQGRKQIVIEECHPVEAFELGDYQVRTQHDILGLVATLTQYIDKLTDVDVTDLIHNVFAEPGLSVRFRESPAAMKMHHAFIGGLLEHVVSMTRAAWLLCNHYKRLDRDILIAGCILHDIGKVEELKTGLSFSYTTKGSLLGHIPMGFALIERVVAKMNVERVRLDIPPFPEEKKLLIQHLILSHHGSLEHGAARIPSTPEAMALSMIDNLDARLEQAWRLIDDAPTEDAFTAFVPSLETRLYCGMASDYARLKIQERNQAERLAEINADWDKLCEIREAVLKGFSTLEKVEWPKRGRCD